MFFRLYLFLATAFVILFLYLSSLNTETIPLRLSASTFYDFHVIPLIFIALLTGFFVNYLITLAKSGKRRFDSMKTARERRSLVEAEELLARAKKSIFLGDAEKGAELLQRCISANGSLLEPYLMLSEYYLEEGDKEKAGAVLHDIPAELEGEIPVQMERAHLYSAEENYKGAAAILKRLVDREGSIDLKRLLRETYMKGGNWQEASSVQNEIVKALKKDEAKEEEAISARITHELAKKMIEEERGDEAAKKFTELTRKSGRFAPPYVNLGKHYWKTGNRDMAVATWQRGYSKTGNLIFIFLLEDFYLKEEEPQEIIEIYKKLIVEEPDNPMLHLFLGKLYLRLEMRDDAIERLKKAEEYGMESPCLSRLIGEALYRMGDFKPASERFKEALGQKQRTLIPFVCDACGFCSDEWQGTCPECGEWDRLRVVVAGAEKAA